MLCNTIATNVVIYLSIELKLAVIKMMADLEIDFFKSSMIPHKTRKDPFQRLGFYLILVPQLALEITLNWFQTFDNVITKTLSLLLSMVVIKLLIRLLPSKYPHWILILILTQWQTLYPSRTLLQSQECTQWCTVRNRNQLLSNKRIRNTRLFNSKMVSIILILQIMKLITLPIPIIIFLLPSPFLF